MNKRTVGLAGAMMAATLLTAMQGCDVGQPAPTLPGNAFVANHPSVGSESGQPIDEPGPLVYDAQHRPQHEAADGDHISNVVKESVKPLSAEAMENADTDFPPPNPTPQSMQPATGAARGVTTGQFQILGTVVAVVNQQPIYADKVLATLERTLKAEAQADDEAHFSVVANDLIAKQVNEFIANDLEFAAAKRALSDKDEQIARYVTTEWRKDQVRKAGGSEAMARQKAAEDGYDFEELVEQQFRLNMTRLYYQNKIFPLIQISAQDIRNYYTANIRQFQQPTAAKFRLIFISSEKSGGRNAALEKARSIAERARHGEDFAKLAGNPDVNDAPNLLRTKGAVGDDKGWMEKGAYASEKVEDAVWQLKPGEISTPIDAPDRGQDGFWIAKLEEVHNGQSEPFESQKVQEAIRETIRRQQFARLREQHQIKLEQDAVVVQNADVRLVMMQMVMQRYRAWTTGK